LRYSLSLFKNITFFDRRAMKNKDILYKKNHQVEPLWLEDYFKLFKNSILRANHNLKSDILTLFNLQKRKSSKIFPTIIVAKPEDSINIKNLIYEVYKGTYPNKRYEDEKELTHILTSENYKWLIFKLNDEIIGALGYKLNFKEKIGNPHGLILKEEYQGKFDMKNTVFACIIYMYCSCKNDVIRYFSEARTKHPKAQSIGNSIGFKPVAFFPNKDLIFNVPESSFLHVIYDQVAIKKFRTEEIPHIIPEIVDFYSYSNKRYGLGRPLINEDGIIINKNKEKWIMNNLNLTKTLENFGKIKFTITLKNSTSYFKFEYDEYNKNIENCRYDIEQLEELECFIKKLKILLQEIDIRYVEVFVSGYEPEHQKILIRNGFIPCGYVPSYFYNDRLGIFEDAVGFCWFKGKIEILKCAEENERFLKETNFFSRIEYMRELT